MTKRPPWSKLMALALSASWMLFVVGPTTSAADGDVGPAPPAAAPAGNENTVGEAVERTLAGVAEALDPLEVAEPDAAPDGAGAGDTVAPAVPDDLRSPRAAVEALLRIHSAVLEDAEGFARRDLLKFMPAAERGALDNAGARRAARLAAVISRLSFSPLRADGAGEGIAGLPGIAALRPGQDSAVLVLPNPEGGRARFRIDRDGDGAWRFSPEAVETGQRLHRELFASEYWLERIFRGLGFGVLVDNGVLGLRYYQIISLFLTIFIGIVLDLLTRVAVAAAARQYLRRREDEKTATDTKALIQKSARPFGLTASGVAVYLLIPTLNLPATGEGVLLVAAKTFALFAGLWASFKVVDLGAEFVARKAARTRTRVDDLLIPLVRKALKVFLLAFGLIFIAESLNLPVTSLVAGFSIAGAAVAFASKDTIENLFGSVAVILDRPFHAGDWVVVDDTEGIVEELGFRSTRIRTFYNSLVTVPNATLVRAVVDNYGRRRFRRFKTVLNLTYDTPPDAVEAFCEAIRELVRRHPLTRKDFYEIHMNDFGAHSLDVLVYMFFVVPDWSTELRERHRFCLDIMRVAARLGVEFAFPTQTLHVFNEGAGGARERAEPDAVSPSNRQPGPQARALGRDVAGAIVSDAEFSG